jgi:peptidoglycan/LPS O-acetylase OafA/YrhL
MSRPSRDITPANGSPARTTELIDLDLIRGCAAVLVALSHWRILIFQNWSDVRANSFLLKLFYFFTGFGYPAVMVFFVLSGFLVGGGVMRAVEIDSWSWKTYLLNRLTRLYVVLVPALILGFFLDRLGIHLFGLAGVYGATNPEFVLIEPDAMSKSLTFASFLGNLAFLQKMVVPAFGSNGPLWSLACEFWYYIAFPLLYIGIFARLHLIKRITSVAAGGLILIWLSGDFAFAFFIWGMGTIAVVGPRPAWIRSKGSRSIAWIVWLLVLLVDRLGLLGRSLRVESLVLGAATAGLLWILSAQPVKSYQISATLFIRRLSALSYSLYLLHLPLLVFLSAQLVRNNRWAPTPSRLVIATGLLPLVAVYVYIMWWLFERQTVAVRKHLLGLLTKSVPSRNSGEI